MKKLVLAFIAAIALLSLFSCATLENGTGVSLQEAIEESAERIASDLPAGTRVAIVDFESPCDNLSHYIMEELTGALFERNIEVAVRRNLEAIHGELMFHLTGDVSDESAISIGRFLGAEVVIVGQLIDTGRVFRFQTTATYVETAMLLSMSRHDVINDQAMRSLAATLANQDSISRVSRFVVDEHSVAETAGALLDRGMFFLERGEWEIAIMDFTDALRVNPNFVAAYVNRGHAHLNNHNSTLAIEDYTQAIRLSPNYADVFYWRGHLYLQRGEGMRANPELAMADMELAMADFNQVVRLEPNNARGYLSRAAVWRFYMTLGRDNHPHFLREIDRVLQISPDNRDAYLMRVRVYMMLVGDREAERAGGWLFDRAIADIETVLQIDPNNLSLMREFRDFLQRTGEVMFPYGSAYVAFTRAITIGREIMSHHDRTLPMPEFDLGQMALYRLDRALDRLALISAYVWRGDDLSSLHDYGAAYEDWLAALQLETDSVSRSRIYQRIENLRLIVGDSQWCREHRVWVFVNPYH